MQDRPQQDHGEQEREVGLGGRVRRFVESELSRVLDKSDRRAGTDESSRAADPDPAEDHPVPAPPPEAGRDPAPERQARREEVRGAEPAAPVVAEDSAGAVHLLNDPAGLRAQWQGIQNKFVDDPQRAVHEAGQLVKRTLEEIRANVGSKQPSETMSTDELRVSFRRYREFFRRLLSA